MTASDQSEDGPLVITDAALLAAREDAEMRVKAREAALAALQDRQRGWRQRRRAAAKLGPLYVEPEWLIALIDDRRQYAARLREHGLLPPA